MQKYAPYTKCKIIEFDLLTGKQREFVGIRYRNKLGTSRTVIWVWLKICIILWLKLQKGLECITVKRLLNGLEEIVDEEIIKMKSTGKFIHPVTLYIQIMDTEKFLIFLYPRKREKQIHFNGTDKYIEEYQYSRLFSIGESIYEYGNRKWIRKAWL